MKCLICFNEHSEHTCPVCGSGVLNIPGNYEEGLRRMMPSILKRRQDILNKTVISVIGYEWKIENDNLELVSKKNIPFGSGNDIYGKTVWLKEEFNSVSSRKNVDVTLGIMINEKTYEKNITVPNKINTESACVGITLDDELNFSFLVKYNDGSSISSEKLLLFNGLAL